MWRKPYVNPTFWNGVETIIREKGYKVRHGRLINDPSLFTQIIDYPWILKEQAPLRYCMKWLLLFHTMGIVPSFCRNNCFKVVVRPKTFADLYKVYEFLMASDMPGKVGVDIRGYAKEPYGAFFYANNWVEAKEFLEKVQAGLADLDAPVILKRMCTEMEAKYPVPEQIPEEKIAEWNDMEFRFDDISEITRPTDPCPLWMHSARWSKWAEKVAKFDDTYKEVLGDIEIIPIVKSVKYGFKGENETEEPGSSDRDNEPMQCEMCNVSEGETNPPCCNDGDETL